MIFVQYYVTFVSTIRLQMESSLGDREREIVSIITLYGEMQIHQDHIFG
jgi:hypothetical protein